MLHTAKKLNIIFYNPGTAGNFLTRLFGLSDDTQFLWKSNTCGCRPNNHSINEKLKYYGYTDKINNWLSDAHMTPYGPALISEHFDTWEFNPIIIMCTHYGVYYDLLKNNDISIKIYPHANLIEKLFHVKVSNPMYISLKRQVGMPDSMAHLDTHIMDTLNTEPIDLDLMLSNDSAFIEEYTRICLLMSLKPVDSNIILDYYHGWKRMRASFESKL